MSLSRSAVALVGVGILGLAGVGVGANAQWEDSVSVSQSISAGTMSLQISSTTEGATGDGTTLTLPKLESTGSSFATPPQTVTIVNDGTLPAALDSVAFSADKNGSSTGKALKDGTLATIVYNGQEFKATLTQLEESVGASLPLAGNVTNLAPNTSLTFTVQFSATALTAAAQGGSVNPTFTIKGSEV